MRVVVTAGGTNEPIDDVRVITNRSTGRLGAALATAFAEAGCDVTLLTSGARPSDRRVTIVPFSSFTDLRDRLAEATAVPVDLLLMAAAVSDYAPRPTVGKIRSSSDTLTLVLDRNPKLLATLRGRVGPHCTLIGFKLLVGVSSEELLSVARRQVADHRLDGCVANDLSELVEGQHPAWLVSIDDPPVRLEGTKAEVARCVARALLPDIDPDVADGLGTASPLQGFGADRVGLQHVWGWCLPTVPGAYDRDDLGPMRAALSRRAYDEGGSIGTFAVRLADGGSLVGISPAELGIARHRWADTVGAWRRERTQLGSDPFWDTPPQPVWDAGTLVGVALDGDPGTAIWLREDARGVGRGDRLLLAVRDRGRYAVSHPRWTADGWFAERGWALASTGADRAVFAPPAEAGARRAASVCLIDVPRGRILLGCRKTPPWLGYWAFPGGSQDPGETLLATAIRELFEETGIALSAPHPLGQHALTVGIDPGYLVTNFVIPMFEAPPPHESAELDARWVTLDDAIDLRPMAAGTRRIVRGLFMRQTWALGRPGVV